MEGKDYGGWMINDFLGIGGLISESLWQIPSGINVVPLTIDGVKQKYDLAAGVTGYNITEDGVTDTKSKRSYPVVQSVHGWGLFHKLVEKKKRKKKVPCFQQ